MKYKHKETLSDVGQFDVGEHGLHYLKTNATLPTLPCIDLPALGFSKYSYLHLLGDFLNVQDTSGKDVLYDLKNGNIVFQNNNVAQHEYGCSPDSISNERKLLVWKKVQATEDVPYIFDVDNNKYKEVNGKFNQIIEKGALYLRREHRPDSITRVELDGSELWSYDITGTALDISGDVQMNKLMRINGLHNDLLWISDRSNELSALNVHTGEKVYSSKKVGYADYYMVDKNKNRLFSLEQNCFRQIDISDDQFTYKAISIEQQFKEIECKPDFGGFHYPIVESHIIFCDRSKSVIGSFNTETYCVDWIHDLFDTRDYAWIKEMKYFNGKLYVMDNRHNLHIFERAS